MVMTEIENDLGFVDKRRTAGQSGVNVATPANFLSVSALRTRLAAASAYYTTARLDQMSKNDMVWALRKIDEAGSI